jgi:hypothetical protein
MQQFFGKYAAAYNFDPLVATNWYRQSSTKILAFKVREEKTVKERKRKRKGTERKACSGIQF